MILALLQSLLQEVDPIRPLDSLETVVVICKLESIGIIVPEDFEIIDNTIAGWTLWAEQRLNDG